MDGDLGTLESLLGHKFNQPQLLHQSLLHSSMAHSRAARMLSNERLEFLGDRVLGLVVADMLFKRFPEGEEGALSRRLVALVRRESLAAVGRTIGLKNHIQMSHGEEESGGRENPGLLADACEAVIAALYLDGGGGKLHSALLASALNRSPGAAEGREDGIARVGSKARPRTASLC
jgi:ribonuclease-3